MNKVISAAELALQIEDIASYDELKNPIIFASLVAIEFAKLHVEAALKASHYNMQLPLEDLEFTVNCYPLSNIE